MLVPNTVSLHGGEYHANIIIVTCVYIDCDVIHTSIHSSTLYTQFKVFPRV